MVISLGENRWEAFFGAEIKSEEEAKKKAVRKNGRRRAAS